MEKLETLMERLSNPINDDASMPPTAAAGQMVKAHFHITTCPSYHIGCPLVFYSFRQSNFTFSFLNLANCNSI